MAEDVKEKIFQFLKETKKEYNITQLAKEIGFSLPTVLKWVEVLNAEGRIDVQDFGNVKIVRYKQNG